MKNVVTKTLNHSCAINVPFIYFFKDATSAV